MKVVAVTNCPTGIAHTYMAAEALQKAAEKLGVDIKVETQGSVGIENELTEKDIAEAHAVILAAGAKIPKDRFQGKTIIEVTVGTAIKNPEDVIRKAINSEKKEARYVIDEISKISAQRKEARGGV